MKIEKFELNKKGVGALLRSEEVSRHLGERANRVRSAAQSGSEKGSETSVELDLVRTRARARVIARGQAGKDSSSALARALDAGA